jgi:predicted phosphodiesterase
MTEVAFLGDMHGNWSALAVQVGRILNETQAKTIYQVGDFGLFPDKIRKNRRLGTIHRRLEEADALMYITPGNHEDWGWMKSWMEDEPTSIPHFPRFVVLPRVWRWELNGTRFLSVSGANSIDFRYRTVGKTWWLEEQITDDIVKEAKRDGKTDVLVCHDSPDHPTSNAVAWIFNENPGGWRFDEREYAEQSSRQLGRIAQATAPSLIVHGHMHVKDSTFNERLGVRIESLDIEGTPGAWITETF